MRDGALSVFVPEACRLFYCRFWGWNWLSAPFSNRLTPREKKIMELRYLQGKTQMEVAQEIGISQAQVSRLEKGALSQFRTRD